MINTFIGCFLIFSGFIIPFIYLIRKLPKPGLAITVCFLMIFTGIFFIIQERATKLIFTGIAEVELAVEQSREDSKEIATRRAEIDSVAKDLFKLKEKFSSMFTLSPEGDVLDTYVDGVHFITYFEGASDYIEPKIDMKINQITALEDGGVVSLIDMSVSATTAEGTVEGYTFDIDANSIVKIYAEANGTGGIKNKKLVCLSNLEIINPDNGVIMTSTNGSKWLMQMKNSGQLSITKF